jgi:acetyl coenzyme A synthetase (ADP forming)-like protein
VRIRPVVPADLEAVTDLFTRLSVESSRMRFHGVRRAGGADLRRFTEVDYRTTMSLVAERAAGNGPLALGLASYARTSDVRAEMAIAVDDAFQGKGIGSLLLEHLAEAAAEAGIAAFEAEILTENRDMLEVVRALEVPVTSKTSMGVVHADFPTALTDAGLEAFERREALAAAAAVARFLRPSSVAVIGASRRRNTIGGELFRNLLRGEFEGPVWPVNPSADVVQSVTAYPTVNDVPGPVDLAVVVVPAVAVIDVARQCGDMGVKALLVISSGFAEVGPHGVQLQRELVEVARAYGMRIVGPNCMGLVNADPAISLNATFAPVAPPRGRLAFSSQSGALGIAVMDRATELGLGISSFVSVGNKADISGNDLLQFWEQDPNTDVMLLYLESFGNPRKFARVARRISRVKPIVAVKSGRSRAGARAAASHTGSIVAEDVAVDALFAQAGVIRTDELEELFDVATLLAYQPLPSGNRVAILTNAGGLGILCADACEGSGLEVPSLSDRTLEGLRALLPAEASVANPVDMIASATAEQYGAALNLLCEDPNVDAVIVIFIPPMVTRAEDVAAALLEGSVRSTGKTVLSCFLGVHGVHELLRAGPTVVPSYTFPESAARALGRVARYAAWRTAGEGTLPKYTDVDRQGAAALAGDVLARGERWIEPDAVAHLMDLYGIGSARSVVVRTPGDVAAAARGIGGAVAVKVDSRAIVHKTDVGGVRLGLSTPEAAEAAATEIAAGLERRGLGGAIDGFLVQEMVASEGAEMFVGMTLDPLFGPLLACGAGGTMVELIRDVSVRITPLTDLDASEMVRSLKSYPLFEGYRGGPPLDREALEDLLLRVSAMVEDLPALAEIDLNPVIVSEAGRGCVVVDARMRIARPKPPTPRGARSMSP